MERANRFLAPFQRSEGWHQAAFRIRQGDTPYSELELKNLLSRNEPQLYEWGDYKAHKRRFTIFYRIKPML